MEAKQIRAVVVLFVFWGFVLVAPTYAFSCCGCICSYLAKIHKEVVEIRKQLEGGPNGTAAAFISFFEKFHTLWALNESSGVINFLAFADPSTRVSSTYSPSYILFGRELGDEYKVSTYTEIAEAISKEVRENVKNGNGETSDLLWQILNNPPIAPTSITVTGGMSFDLWAAVVTRYTGLISGEPVDPFAMIEAAEFSQRGRVLRDLIRNYVQRKMLTDVVVQAAASLEAADRARDALAAFGALPKNAPQTVGEAIRTLLQVAIVNAYLQTKILEEIANANILLADTVARNADERQQMIGTAPKRQAVR